MGIALIAMPRHVCAQEPDSGMNAMLEAPQPQIAQPPPESLNPLTPANPSQSAQQPASGAAPPPPAPGTSSSQTPAEQPAAGKSQSETSAEQLKEQEHQRVMGVMATFNTTRRKDALPLTPGEKFQLFFKSSTDPWPFLLAGAVSGIGQANNSDEQWGQGAQGYAKRYGAAYSDAFIGNFFGNAVLPVVLHEDPRYFQMGTGSPTKRILWAASSSVWCRRDNGKWGPNYANVGGNLIGSAIARAYYPASERDVGDAIGDGLTVTAEGVIGAELIEFWPDLVRHHKRKRAEKLARQTAPSDSGKAASPHPDQLP